MLLIDFRDKLHVRRHEQVQRAITELTVGVIGISPLTNWYYYLGMSLYEFIAGPARDTAARIWPVCFALIGILLLLYREV